MNYGSGYEAYSNDDYGGGGFMDPSSSQGASQNTPSKGGRGGGRSRESQTLVPVTVRQLLNRTEQDDVIRVDNHEISSIKVVGILNNVSPHSTNVTFQLDDGTGVIEGRMFLHSDDVDFAEAEMAKFRDGIYVRAVGSLRTFQDKLSLSCFAVTPVEDFNEITHHFLEVIYVHCYNTKGALQSSTATKSAAGGDNFQMQQSSWNQGTNSTYLGQSSGGMASMGSMDYNMDSSFSNEQKAILDVLGTCTSDRGLKIDQIFMQLRGQMTEHQLRDALNYLTSEGHVYSTIDEDHFKRTA
ncbi:hypothetical protein Poli38472_007358 [Pythium oligandrum]|uniref:Replication protein A 32 kDa subunit n=1 Tax=Pythium oligandrum TaxID=41045 RepID=A0A8K1CAN2_PYTOL|nr:hypothetical protein Poli38472_007358 [Pythium oligandrum]|eukprot:TMW59213.1 hypothetical protein Poli38472_007358 [Pythium oligandrum]